MKAQNVLFVLCAVLWFTSEDCNCLDQKDTYKEWARAMETLTRREAQVPDTDKKLVGTEDQDPDTYRNLAGTIQNATMKEEQVLDTYYKKMAGKIQNVTTKEAQVADTYYKKLAGTMQNATTKEAEIPETYYKKLAGTMQTVTREDAQVPDTYYKKLARKMQTRAREEAEVPNTYKKLARKMETVTTEETQVLDTYEKLAGTPVEAQVPDTYKNLARKMETLTKEEAQVPKDDYGRECKAMSEEQLGWIYLRELFETKKKTGILNFAWPRLSFYSEHLKALTESPSLQEIVLCDWQMGVAQPRICFKKKCGYCDEEIMASNDETLIQICTQKYPKPEEAELDPERTEELAGILKLPVESPGALSLEEVDLWIERKLEKKEKVGEADGDDCNAPPELTMSLSYLRRMWEGGANTTEKRKEELASHPEFYLSKLGWLKGADLEETVPCGKELVCGWDGACVKCDGGFEDAKDLGLREACALDRIGEWEDANNVAAISKFGSPLEAYANWVGAILKVKNRLVDKDSQEKSCSASVDQSISWPYLEDLFYVFQKSGVMRWAWPRIAFFDEKLEEVLNAAEDVVFCDWDLGRENRSLCLNGKCKECAEMNLTGYGNDLYEKRCAGTLEGPPWLVNKVREEEAEKLRRIGEMEEPQGVLTLEEALGWNETLKTTVTVGSLEECDVARELTLAVKLLMGRVMKVEADGEKGGWRWRTREEVEEEMARNRTMYDDKLRWLKGADKTRRICGDNLVCRADGLCVACEVAVVTTEGDQLGEACWVEVGVGRGRQKVS